MLLLGELEPASHRSLSLGYGETKCYLRHLLECSIQPRRLLHCIDAVTPARNAHAEGVRR